MAGRAPWWSPAAGSSAGWWPGTAPAIVAGRAHTSPELPLAHLAAEPDESGTAALDDDDPTASLPAVLGTSYRALTDEHRHAMRLLALAPGPDIGLAGGRVPHRPARTRAARAPRALHEASLLDHNGRYRMHDLVRSHTNPQELPEAERAAALSRVVDHYLHTAHHADHLLYPHREPLPLTPPVPGAHARRSPDADEDMAWFYTEHPNLPAATHTAAATGRHHVVWQLAWALDTFHFRRGHRDDRVAVWQAALDAAAHIPDPAARVSAHRNLGIAHAVRGRPRTAVEHLRRSLALAEQHDDPAQQARTLQMLGWAWQWQGDPRLALEHAERAPALHDRLDQPVLRADTLNQIGWYAARLGDHDTAHDRFRAALPLHRRHHNPDGEAAALDGLGYVSHVRDRHREAVHHYEQALALRRRLGHAYGEADILERLGHAHAALGDADRAGRVWRETLSKCEEQGRVHDADRIRRLLGLGHPDA